jgi:hypothetical protein
VTSQQDVDQLLHVSSWSEDVVSFGSMDQEGVFAATAGSAPQSLNTLSEFDFSAPMIGMDSHLNDIDSSQFAFSSSPMPFLDLLNASDDVSKMASLTGSPDTATAL